jgi:DNA-binding MarR family transcriptional regulator
MHWTNRLHHALIAISDRVNRLDLDARLLAASGVRLDRALFPLLSRVALNPDFNVAELANLVGRDHSTVSRQIVKLEQLGLLARRSDPKDQRSRQLALTAAGEDMLQRVAAARRRMMEEHFADWDKSDRDQLIDLMGRMLNQGGLPPPPSAAGEGRAEANGV